MAAPMNDITPQFRAGAQPEESVRTLTGAEIIWETLGHQGVEVLFGYPCGASCRRTRHDSNTRFGTSLVTSMAAATWPRFALASVKVGRDGSPGPGCRISSPDWDAMLTRFPHRLHTVRCRPRCSAATPS